MQGIFFMQLFIILALLLYGGKTQTQNLLQEVKPMLETFGGEELKEALKSAEEISQVLTAVRGFGAFQQPERQESNPSESDYFNDSVGANAKNPAVSFPLAPISNIADRDITYSLSQYVK